MWKPLVFWRGRSVFLEVNEGRCRGSQGLHSSYRSHRWGTRQRELRRCDRFLGHEKPPSSRKERWAERGAVSWFSSTFRILCTVTSFWFLSREIRLVSNPLRRGARYLRSGNIKLITKASSFDIYHEMNPYEWSIIRNIFFEMWQHPTLKVNAKKSHKTHCENSGERKTYSSQFTPTNA